jgi:hypothetical protein
MATAPNAVLTLLIVSTELERTGSVPRFAVTPSTETLALEVTGAVPFFVVTPPATTEAEPEIIASTWVNKTV